MNKNKMIMKKKKKEKIPSKRKTRFDDDTGKMYAFQYEKQCRWI